MRLKVRQMKAYVHWGVARVIDSFETEDYFYICFEREDFEHLKYQPVSARTGQSLFQLFEKMCLKDYIRML